MRIIKLIFGLTILIGFQSELTGQSIFDNPITGTNPNTSNPYTTGQTVDPNITVSGIGRGTGINGSNANNRYNANAWNSSSLDVNDYFYWTLTPNSGKKINFTSLDFNAQVSATGPVSFAFRSSLDNYTSDIAAPSIANDGNPHSASVDLSGSAFQNITSAITFRYYAWGASASGGTFSINDFQYNGSTALPIQLKFLLANIKNTITELIFSTATESNNDYFSIERSSDGRSFSEIGQVKGAGTSYEPQDYTFTDEHPLRGKNYYRLRQVDFDGKYSYSPVVTATFGKASLLSLAPLPATESLQIRLEEAAATDGVYQIIDLNGRLLQSGDILAETREKALNISELPEGAYVLRLLIGQEAMVEQFRKMK